MKPFWDGHGAFGVTGSSSAKEPVEDMVAFAATSRVPVNLRGFVIYANF